MSERQNKEYKTTKLDDLKTKTSLLSIHRRHRSVPQRFVVKELRYRLEDILAPNKHCSLNYFLGFGLNVGWYLIESILQIELVRCDSRHSS